MPLSISDLQRHVVESENEMTATECLQAFKKIALPLGRIHLKTPCYNDQEAIGYFVFDMIVYSFQGDSDNLEDWYALFAHGPVGNGFKTHKYGAIRKGSLAEQYLGITHYECFTSDNVDKYWHELAFVLQDYHYDKSHCEIGNQYYDPCNGLPPMASIYYTLKLLDATNTGIKEYLNCENEKFKVSYQEQKGFASSVRQKRMNTIILAHWSKYDERYLGFSDISKKLIKGFVEQNFEKYFSYLSKTIAPVLWIRLEEYVDGNHGRFKELRYASDRRISLSGWYSVSIFKNKKLQTAFHAESDKLIRFIEIILEKESASMNDGATAAVIWYQVKKQMIAYYDSLWQNKYQRKIAIEQADSGNSIFTQVARYLFMNEDISFKTAFTAYVHLHPDQFQLESVVFLDTTHWVGEQLAGEKEIIEKQLFEESLLAREKPVFQGNAIDVDTMDGYEFEAFVAELFKRMGYDAEVTRSSGDQGVDVIASKDSIFLGIQAKCYNNVVGNGAVQEVISGVRFYNLDKGFVVTNNYFTHSASELAASSRVTLWNRDVLLEKIAQYFK